VKRVEEGEYGIWLMYFLHMYEYGTLKPFKVILRRGKGKRENNGGDEPHRGTLGAYTEMLQQNSLYNYYILIKTLKIKIMENF
jgi:hypothetical protein